MNRLGAVVFGVAALAVASAGVAWAQQSQVPSLGGSTAGQPLPGGIEQGVPERTPLFRIGGVPVYVWAPVEPHYDSRSNRSPADNMRWQMGMPSESGY